MSQKEKRKYNMARKRVISQFIDYLKSHNIQYVMGIDEGYTLLTMVYPVENAPGKAIESCIWFYEDEAEVRAYYTSVGAEVCRSSMYIDELLKVLNFINARVFLGCADPCGLYKSQMLYTPRIYLTEDGQYDICITTIINYDFWELAPIETSDYITAYCPQLLDRITIPLFGTVLGNIGVKVAKTQILDALQTQWRRQKVMQKNARNKWLPR